MEQMNSTPKPKSYPVFRIAVSKADPGWWIWEIMSQSLPVPISGSATTRREAIKRAGLVASRIHRQ